MSVKRNVVKDFDEWTGTYTKDMERFVPHYKKLLNSVVDYLPEDFKPRNILELGCGNGNSTAILINQFPDSAYTLLDASAEMLKVCKKRFSDYSIHYIEQYMQDASFETDAFDLIVATLSIHHLNSQEKKELFINLPVWLIKNGIFMYTDLMIDHQNKVLHDPFMKRWETFARSNETTDEEWEWLSDHHYAYDKTDDANEQMKWLRSTNLFVDKPWSVEDWTCLRAINK